MEHVEASVIEEAALSMPTMPQVSFKAAEISADFDAMLGWAEALKASYLKAEFSQDEAGYREAKASRAALRTYIRDIDARRKAVKAEYSAPLAAFEARVKLVTGALGDAADACDAYVKGWEDAAKQRKRDAIEAAYEEYAPLLVDVLPFRRFYDLMLQRGRKWENQKPTLPTCIEEMQEDVARIAFDLNAVQEIRTGHLDVARRVFWQTLDLAEARRQAKAADEEDERIEALRAEQERIAEARRAEAERREAERREAENAALAQRDAREATRTEAAEEAPRASETERESAAEKPEAPRAEQRRSAWTIEITGTEEQAMAVWKFAMGMHLGPVMAKGSAEDVAWGRM